MCILNSMNTDKQIIPEQFDFTPVAQSQQAETQRVAAQFESKLF
jgi:hypothetical protein